MQLLKKMENLLKLKNYSQKTIKAYLFHVNKYLIFTQKKNIKEKNKAIKSFLLEKQKHGKSPQTINLALSAIKFLYREVLRSKDKINLKYARKSQKLPIILSKKEIEKIIFALQNSKHKLIISIGYATGLRISEIVNLKIKDIDLNELIIHVKDTKAKKDRITIFSEKLITAIKKMIYGQKNNNFIFKNNRGEKLTTTSLQKIFKTALKKTRIKKQATFHSLRHSFATHLLENGIDIHYVQKLLGHKNIRTTQIYIKITNPNIKNIKSPFV